MELKLKIFTRRKKHLKYFDQGWDSHFEFKTSQKRSRIR